MKLRASEGSLRFNVDFSPMASPAFEGGRPGEAAVEANRLLERAFRNAGAVDLEALCVVAGVKACHGPCGTVSPVQHVIVHGASAPLFAH